MVDVKGNIPHLDVKRVCPHESAVEIPAWFTMQSIVLQTVQESAWDSDALYRAVALYNTRTALYDLWQ